MLEIPKSCFPGYGTKFLSMFLFVSYSCILFCFCLLTTNGVPTIAMRIPYLEFFCVRRQLIVSVSWNLMFFYDRSLWAYSWILATLMRFTHTPASFTPTNVNYISLCPQTFLYKLVEANVFVLKKTLNTKFRIILLDDFRIILLDDCLESNSISLFRLYLFLFIVQY